MDRQEYIERHSFLTWNLFNLARRRGYLLPHLNELALIRYGSGNIKALTTGQLEKLKTEILEYPPISFDDKPDIMALHLEWMKTHGNQS